MAASAVELEEEPVETAAVESEGTGTTEAAEPQTADGKQIKRLRDLRTSQRDQFMIDPRIIRVEDGHNPRDYTVPENRLHLDDLKASIRENGTLNPLWVRFDSEKKSAVLVDGECRLRANLELIAEGVEIEAVPCIQVPGGNEPDRLLLAIVANQNKPLSKLELGGAFQRLYKFGWSPEKIAKKSGVTTSFIKQSMELADAPEEVKTMVAKQEITPSLAISEVRQNGAAAVETLRKKAKAAKASGKTVAKRERVVKPPAMNLVPLIRKIIKGITPGELENAAFDFVDVDRKLMLALSRLVNL